MTSSLLHANSLLSLNRPHISHLLTAINASANDHGSGEIAAAAAGLVSDDPQGQVSPSNGEAVDQGARLSYEYLRCVF